MKRWLWVEGRLAWPPVAAIAYFAVCLVLADYSWRLLVMPFGTFLLYSFFIAAGGAGLLIVFGLLLRRSSGRRKIT